jgi:hypothetical protein
MRSVSVQVQNLFEGLDVDPAVYISETDLT